MHHFTPAGDSHPKPGGSALAWDVHVLSSNYESVGAAPHTRRTERRAR